MQICCQDTGPVCHRRLYLDIFARWLEPVNVATIAVAEKMLLLTGSPDSQELEKSVHGASDILAKVDRLDGTAIY